MINLLYVDPSGLGLWDGRFLNLLAAAAAAETQVAVRHLEGVEGSASLYLPDRPENYYGPLLGTIGKAEEEGFDAVMLGCASEPALRAASNAARIPVIGPFGAALHVAGLLGRRIGVLCPAERGQRKRPLVWHEQTVRLYGIAESQVAFRLVDVRKPEPDLVAKYLDAQDFDGLRSTILARYRESILDSGREQARRAVEEDRAEVLFFACTLWGGLLSPVAEAVDVPILDPVVTLLKASEAAVQSGRAARNPVRTSHGFESEEAISR